MGRTLIVGSLVMLAIAGAALLGDPHGIAPTNPPSKGGEVFPERGEPYRPPPNSHLRTVHIYPDIGLAYLSFEGPIEAADVEAFQEAVAYVSPRADSVYLDLDSDGGDLRAAMDIGRIVRKLWMSTAVGDQQLSARCLSACVFIFAAGARRTVGPYSIIGVHRPVIEGYGSLSRSAAQAQYDRVVKMVRDYLSEMGMREGLAAVLLASPSDTPRSLPWDAMIALNLVGSDPGYEEWMRARREKRLGRADR